MTTDFSNCVTLYSQKKYHVCKNAFEKTAGYKINIVYRIAMVL